MLLMKAPSVPSERCVVLSWIHTPQHMRQENHTNILGLAWALGPISNRSNEGIYMNVVLTCLVKWECAGNVISLKVRGDHVQDAKGKTGNALKVLPGIHCETLTVSMMLPCLRIAMAPSNFKDQWTQMHSDGDFFIFQKQCCNCGLRTCMTHSLTADQHVAGLRTIPACLVFSQGQGEVSWCSVTLSGNWLDVYKFSTECTQIPQLGN